MDDAQAILDALEYPARRELVRARGALDRFLVDRDRLTEQNGSLVARLRRAVEWLEAHGYMREFASWTDDPDRADIHLRAALADIAVGDSAAEDGSELQAALSAHRPSAECAEVDGLRVTLREALRVLGLFKDEWGGCDIPEELSARLDLPLDLAWAVREWLRPDRASRPEGGRAKEGESGSREATLEEESETLRKEQQR